MNDTIDLAIRFSSLLDARLGVVPEGKEDEIDYLELPGLLDDVEFALSVWPGEFPEESLAKEDIRSRLSTYLNPTVGSTIREETGGRFFPKLLNALASPLWKIARVAVGAMLLLILLQIFQVPVWAALQRLTGYGYAPKAGIVPLHGTMVLPRAVVLDSGGGGVEIEQIVVTSSTLELWIASEGDRRSPSIAEISMPNGKRAALIDGYSTETSLGQLESYWRFRGEFESPPWIEIRLDGSQARRIPLQSAVQLLAPLREFRTCDSHNGISLCAVALSVEADSTCSLIEISLQDVDLVNGFAMLVGSPMEPHSTIAIQFPESGVEIAVPPGYQTNALRLVGEQATFLQQLCFPVEPSGGAARLEIPAVEVILPITSQLSVPVVSPDQGWVDLSERVQWQSAELSFEQARAFPGEGKTIILRVLGFQSVSGSGPVITSFTPEVQGDGRVEQTGSSHDPRKGLHTIDIWIHGERSDLGQGSVLAAIRYPHLTFPGPFYLLIEGGSK